MSKEQSTSKRAAKKQPLTVVDSDDDGAASSSLKTAAKATAKTAEKAKATAKSALSTSEKVKAAAKTAEKAKPAVKPRKKKKDDKSASEIEEPSLVQSADEISDDNSDKASGKKPDGKSADKKPAADDEKPPGKVTYKITSDTNGKLLAAMEILRAIGDDPSQMTMTKKSFRSLILSPLEKFLKGEVKPKVPKKSPGINPFSVPRETKPGFEKLFRALESE